LKKFVNYLQYKTPKPKKIILWTEALNYNGSDGDNSDTVRSLG
jgi:hypothetical protein